jgi:hypothetical protein
MKWLQDNFVGMALLAGIAALLLVSVSLFVVWAWPVSGDFTDQADEGNETGSALVAARVIGPFEDYQVINEAPVFNITRAPELDDGEEPEVLVDVPVEPKEAPNVRLTGVFISPGLRIASLMPVEGEQISVRAKEGEALIGDYVGWQVSKVRPRHVVLESRDGETLKLDLKVHDSVIVEPPKMQPLEVTDAALAGAEEEGVPLGEDGQPLSRAEQIRARIAERREELRRQQQGIESDDPAQEGEQQKAAPPPSYQSAIQAMMQNSNKDKKSDDQEDN